MKPLLTAGAFACLCVPAFASDCTTQTFSEVVSLIEENGGRVIAIVDVEAAEFDQVIIAKHGKTIVVGRFMDDCAVGGPALLGAALSGA